jgi:N-acetylneuraminic acid mutarotase
LTYDSKNQVVLLVGGASDIWDSRKEYFNDVWAYDVAKNTWTKMEPMSAKPKVSGRECRHCAYDRTTTSSSSSR